MSEQTQSNTEQTLNTQKERDLNENKRIYEAAEKRIKNLQDSMNTARQNYADLGGDPNELGGQDLGAGKSNSNSETQAPGFESQNYMPGETDRAEKKENQVKAQSPFQAAVQKEVANVLAAQNAREKQEQDVAERKSHKFWRVLAGDRIQSMMNKNPFFAAIQIIGMVFTEAAASYKQGYHDAGVVGQKSVEITKKTAELTSKGAKLTYNKYLKNPMYLLGSIVGQGVRKFQKEPPMLGDTYNSGKSIGYKDERTVEEQEVKDEIKLDAHQKVAKSRGRAEFVDPEEQNTGLKATKAENKVAVNAENAKLDQVLEGKQLVVSRDPNLFERGNQQAPAVSERGTYIYAVDKNELEVMKNAGCLNEKEYKLSDNMDEAMGLSTRPDVKKEVEKDRVAAQERSRASSKVKAATVNVARKSSGFKR